jgi:Tfp pilus assembly protein PilN
MNSVNLIPLKRQLRDERSTRLRAWGAALGALSCLLAVAYGVAAFGPSDLSAPPASAFSKAAGEVARANQEAAILRTQLAALNQQSLARQLIVDQPDRSVLLALLARAVDADVVLNQCELLHGTSQTATESQVLKISGYARTQPSVAGFMLQLEGTGIFKSVQLLRSSDRPLLTGRVAAFEVQCVLGPPGKGAQ